MQAGAGSDICVGKPIAIARARAGGENWLSHLTSKVMVRKRSATMLMLLSAT